MMDRNILKQLDLVHAFAAEATLAVAFEAAAAIKGRENYCKGFNFLIFNGIYQQAWY